MCLSGQKKDVDDPAGEDDNKAAMDKKDFSSKEGALG